MTPYLVSFFQHLNLIAIQSSINRSQQARSSDSNSLQLVDGGSQLVADALWEQIGEILGVKWRNRFLFHFQDRKLALLLRHTELLQSNGWRGRMELNESVQNGALRMFVQLMYTQVVDRVKKDMTEGMKWKRTDSENLKEFCQTGE